MGYPIGPKDDRCATASNIPARLTRDVYAERDVFESSLQCIFHSFISPFQVALIMKGIKKSTTRENRQIVN